MSLSSHQFRFVSAWPPANLALAEGCRGACETEVYHTYDMICQHGKWMVEININDQWWLITMRLAKKNTANKNRWIINKYTKWINRQVKHGDNLPSSQRVPPRLSQTCCYDIGASKRLVPCQQSWSVHNSILKSDSLKRVQCLENNKSLPRKQYRTAEIPITSSENTIKSNQINFKRFNFHWLCCLNRSVWSQEQVHSTSGFTSGCHTFAFLEAVTWEPPRS